MKTYTLFTKEELLTLQNIFYTPLKEEIFKLTGKNIEDSKIEDLIIITDKLTDKSFNDILFARFYDFLNNKIVNNEKIIEEQENKIKLVKEDIKRSEIIKKYLQESDDFSELLSNIYLIK